jgi:tRNA-modifying protein YgfZ
MQNTWHTFLQEQGATIKDNGEIYFSTPDISISESHLVCPLSGFTTLAISGDDRHAFLHGQFINDLNLIDKPAAQISAWCNPKGQVITNFLIVNTGIAYLLIFKTDLKDVVQKRLGMFIMRSDVMINDISDSSPLIGLANTNDLSSLNSDIPTSAGEVCVFAGLIVICHPDNSGRYLITGSIEALTKNIPALDSTMTSSPIWDLLDILSGLPWLTSISQEQFLPQMLNLDLLKGLSYQKGCYPGQEVIARLHYRGEIKKRLHLIKSAQPLATGNNLYLKDAENKVGVIINSGSHPDGNTYALAVITLDKTTDKLFADTQSNHEVSIQELPYAIES